MRGLLTEKRKDSAARLFIRVGGVLVILVVVAIVANIGLEALPLFQGASAGPLQRVDVPDDALLAGSGPRREIVWVLTPGGEIVFAGSEERTTLQLSASPVVAADIEVHNVIAFLDDAGAVSVGGLRFRDDWVDGERTTEVRWRQLAEPLPLPQDRPWAGVTATADGDGSLAAAAWDSAVGLVVAVWDGDDEVWSAPSRGSVPQGIRSVAIAQGLGVAAVVGNDGELRLLRVPELAPVDFDGGVGSVAVARFLIGGGSLVVAGRDGAVSVLLEVPRVTVANRSQRAVVIDHHTVEAGETVTVYDDQVGQRLASRTDVELGGAPPIWRVVRVLDPMPGEPTWIGPAHRRRGFLVGAGDGTVALYHSTSGRRLMMDRWSDAAVRSVTMDPKGDGAVVLVGDDLLRRAITNPHPEVSLRTLFLPVWYEGYARPRWVWQTTGGSDVFEPKMSLWPLIFGTLKATLYAMLLSVPLALMAAVYVSQLAPGWLQSIVKPTVELMAAVPSVVVGFLAALWLAPRLEEALLAVLLGLIALPVAVVVALGLWRIAPEELRSRMPKGGELPLLLGSAAAAVAAVAVLAGPLEAWLFGGDFQRYLFTEWGIRYDQRNSLVVGLGLGFAVIPVIFSIAEDACSAVPDSLVNASRALGATRWQTAVRLVVPAASPGLFAAVMLGLGRAVGETMIVLMAAGNTPLLDLSLFNGMRTMSAAIAVEIPEAPVGSTLFRVLFLTGTLLFLFTLAVTTAADLVGTYLRRRYARF
jgi:phosphate transport system permease protein